MSPRSFFSNLLTGWICYGIEINVFNSILQLRCSSCVSISKLVFTLAKMKLLLCDESGLRYSCYYIVYGLQESPSATVMNATQLKYDVVSTVTDRSILNDEMASMCAKLPIYLIKKTTTQRKSSVSTKLQSDVNLNACLR